MQQTYNIVAEITNFEDYPSFVASCCEKLRRIFHLSIYK